MRSLRGLMHKQRAAVTFGHAYNKANPLNRCIAIGAVAKFVPDEGSFAAENQPISVSKAKKAIADYKKAIGRSDEMAELSIFYCEEAFSFLESCNREDEGCFVALIRMYERSLEFVLSLPPAERATYLVRLDKLRSRGRHVGWGVQDELNSLWYAAVLDEHQSE